MWEIILNFFKMHPGFTVIGAVTLIQITPIKINPWTALARWIRKIIIGDIEKKIDRIAEKVDQMEAQSKEDKAIQARAYILQFSDEIYNGEKHSKDYFDNIMQAIDQYEQYCEQHKDFINNRTALSVQRIKETYSRLLKEHKFL